LILFPVLFVIQLFFVLLSQWSIDFQCYANYTKVSTPKEATNVRVVPAAHKGSRAIVPLHEISTNSPWFEFQKRKYRYDASNNKFDRPRPSAQLFGELKRHQGHTSSEMLQEVQHAWGNNAIDIPLPRFSELYKEQALAPFFVFQVFCVALWCLDDYWQYSLFTLFMLLVFEATVVQSRMKNLQLLRSMVSQPQDVRVYREHKWLSVKSSELVPGDICLVQKKKDEAHVIVPCDMILLAGQCIANEAILTGESTPQLKESVQQCLDEGTLDLRRDKVHVLYGGTKIVQHSGDSRVNKSFKAAEEACLCVVLKTGFNTSQGKLVRTILFSSERITANNRESFLFIAFLLVFALAASGYVLVKGLREVEEGKRALWKLILECTLIITSVVPPELPMELSLAVNTSLVNLSKLQVFCTEPFRIPLAGGITHACFDKTGTLTDEHLRLVGVTGLDLQRTDHLHPVNTLAQLTPDAKLGGISATALVMAGCHAAVWSSGAAKPQGDPLEVSMIDGIGGALQSTPSQTGEVTVTLKAHSQRALVRIRQRFHFTSALKRMSTVVSLDHIGTSHFVATAKGAPETIEQYLSADSVDVQQYRECYLHFTRQGKRVIAMAYKPLPELHSADQLRHVTREQIECDLIFAGFLILECPLKSDSSEVIAELIESQHRVVVITGDNALTACQVAQELRIAPRPLRMLHKQDATLAWLSIDDYVRASLGHVHASPSADHVLDDAHDYCVTGELLEEWARAHPDSDWESRVTVYARCSPQIKAWIISRLKSKGYHTLMCGDGTNDVGALKQAHVGIALLSTESLEMLNALQQRRQARLAGGTTAANINNNNSNANSDVRSRANRTPAPTNNNNTANNNANATPANAREAGSFLSRLQRQLEEAQREQNEGNAMVQLGDACIASPFTVKSNSIGPILHILRQGRCTLVTTLQMYRILALHCLIYAYSLSVLYHDGIKYGDTQATISGMLTAMCFLFISRSQPLKKLASKRPLNRIFTPFMFASILGQFALHLSALMYISNLSQSLVDVETKPKPDADFKPNLVNTAVFLISMCMQLATFVVNYEGHPFMESLSENKPLRNCLALGTGFTFLAASQILPELNDTLSLVEMPADFRATLLIVMAADFSLSWAYEKLCRKLFT
jgi:cation-transporting ATPase 13A1